MQKKKYHTAQNYRLSNSNPTTNPGWTHVLRMGAQFRSFLWYIILYNRGLDFFIFFWIVIYMNANIGWYLPPNQLTSFSSWRADLILSCWMRVVLSKYDLSMTCFRGCISFVSPLSEGHRFFKQNSHDNYHENRHFI